jgi:hypothetical protein
MPFYRAFLLDTDDHVFASDKFDCDDDKAALARAAEITTPCSGIEVWEGRRVVGYVKGTIQPSR